MIEHDVEWLKDKSRSRKYWQPHDGMVAPEDYAKRYHEHMTKETGERVSATLYQAFGAIDSDVLAGGEWERVMDWLSSTSAGEDAGELLPVELNERFESKLKDESAKRWRPLSEKPADGDLVHVCYEVKHKDGSHNESELFVYGNAGFDFDAFLETTRMDYEPMIYEVSLIAWRPAPLPSDEEIQALIND